MSDRFDEMAKDLAGEMSRRAALEKMAGLLAGALLTALGVSRAGEAAVVVDGRARHTTVGPRAGGSCPDGRKPCRGICCGAGYACCSGRCVNLQWDPSNCGRCGSDCGRVTGSNCNYCSSGACVAGCRATHMCCPGGCVPATGDCGGREGV